MFLLSSPQRTHEIGLCNENVPTFQRPWIVLEFSKQYARARKASNPLVTAPNCGQCSPLQMPPDGILPKSSPDEMLGARESSASEIAQAHREQTLRF